MCSQFPHIPRVARRSDSARNTTSIASGLSPLSRLVLEKAPLFSHDPGQAPPTPVSSKGQLAASPTTPKLKSPSAKRAKPPAAVDYSAANIQAYTHNATRIEVSVPLKRVERTPVHAKPAESIVTSTITEPAPEPRLVTAIPAAAPISAPVSPSVPVPTSPSAVQNQLPVTPTRPPPLPTGSSRLSFTVEIPHSAGFNKDEYIQVPDSPDEPQTYSTRKRKLDGREQDLFAVSFDQRQRAEAALRDLRRLTQEVFGAVGHVLASEPGFSHIVTMTNDQEPSLTAGTQQKVQASIQKVIGLGSYDQVPLEDLIRYQKLSEGTLKQVDGLDMKIDESWGASDLQGWLEQIPDIENGLKAARTSLRIMSGGREDKQLYSEDLIQKCVDIFKNVMDDIVVPMAQMRGSGSAGTLFGLLSPHKKTISAVFNNAQKLFSILANLVTTVELSETVLNTLEFTASRLIFVENAYYEKDSVVGVQKFDGIRLVAMDMLCQIFLGNPQQRQGIFDDILTSLEKLPVSKQSARQFKLTEGGSIQPVSALIMRLVQSSSGRVEDKKEKHGAIIKSLEDDGEPSNNDENDEPADGSVGKILSTIKSEDEGAIQHAVSIKDLDNVVAPLTDVVQRNASYVVNFIVNRALNSTKSGDTPYRNLLDLFVEDFTTCLELPDWPAAELLLRLLMLRMVNLSEGEKTSAPAKNMALEIIGTMCAATSKLRSHVRKTASSIDGSESDELSRFIADLASSALELRNRPEHMVSWSGPFRVTLEYLEERCSTDPHLKGAISYLISCWASRVSTVYDGFEDNLEERDQEFGRLGYRLRKMIEDRRWLTNEYEFKSVSANQAKLGYAVILLRSHFCEAFGAILNILLRAMASDQATVRSKALRSINQVLEIDPSILDGDSVVVQLILQCSNDSSTQVRDSALGLIGKCIALRPGLEETMTPRIIERFLDSGVGVRKRAMKLARDIYLRDKSRVIRSSIANGLLHRVQDPDEGVRDLARQMIEEVWFAPFYNAESTATFQTSLTDHVALVVQTVKSGNVTAVMDKVLQSILGPQNKTLEGPFGVCAKLVANMFDLIDTLDSDDPAIPSGRDALQVLMIFAKADAKLFTFEQIRLLKPHLASFSGGEDLTVFRAVVMIYRRVLPQLSPSLHAQFLADIRVLLQTAIGKVGRVLLDDVVACLWIIAQLLDASKPLARLASSSLVAVQKLRAAPLGEKGAQHFARYSLIIGMVGKHCNVDDHIDIFRGAFPKWQGTNCAKLMVDSMVPFAVSTQPQDVRRAALDAMGLICQAWPRIYVSPNVYTTFQQAFDEQTPILETTILKSFKEFLLTEEKRSEAASAAANGAETGKRELTVMGGTTYDDVASATTQRFLKEFTRIAVASLDEHAFLAVEVLGSINRQGLVHPKETGVTLMTLETSPIRMISEMAFQEHRALHEKHETVLEREYVKAIQSAFHYQRDVVGDAHGATTNPFQSKLYLLMEVLKISKSKNRQKFLEKFVVQIDFDWTKLEVGQETPYHVGFSRFLVENLAFFDYMTVGELQATVNAMEKLVTSTGASVAQVIESEVFHVRMEMDPAPEMQDGGQMPVASTIEPTRLRRMTSASIILLSLWAARTYLRKLYGMGASRRETKGKGQAKDLSKAPIKAPGVNGDKFWEEVASNMAGFESSQSSLQKLQEFVELMNVDKEFKVVDEDEELNGENPTTPSDAEGEDDEVLGSGRGRKRKANGTPGGRKKRQRSTSRARPRGRPRKQVMEEDADGDFDEDWV
jgi:cohesin loading factor subunit SCC2